MHRKVGFVIKYTEIETCLFTSIGLIGIRMERTQLKRLVNDNISGLRIRKRTIPHRSPQENQQQQERSNGSYGKSGGGLLTPFRGHFAVVLVTQPCLDRYLRELSKNKTLWMCIEYIPLQITQHTQKGRIYQHTLHFFTKNFKTITEYAKNYDLF